MRRFAKWLPCRHVGGFALCRPPPSFAFRHGRPCDETIAHDRAGRGPGGFGRWCRACDRRQHTIAAGDAADRRETVTQAGKAVDANLSDIRACTEFIASECRVSGAVHRVALL